MDTTDRRALLTAGLASSVIVLVLALAVAAVVAALVGGTAGNPHTHDTRHRHAPHNNR
jgi:hypothetical protein